MIAIGTNELGPEIPAGARVKCGVPGCGASHPVVYAPNDLMRLLAIYECDGRVFVCGLGGRLLPGEVLSDA